MARIFYQQDCDLGKLSNKTVAIIGYGSQGHAHALNLKESGINVVVGLYEGSKSWAKAEAQGLKVMTAADAQGIGKAQVPGVAGGILLHGDETGNALTGLVFAADSMTGAFRCNHDDIDIFWRFDASEMDVEAVGKGQGLAFGQVGFDGFFIQCGLLFVVDEDHDDVGSLGCLGTRHDRKSLCLCLCPALGTLVKTDNDVDTAIL